MAIIYFSYLFDDKGFLQTLNPIIPEVEKGNFRPLYQLAKKTMEEKPSLWSLLDTLYLGLPFQVENEDTPSPQRLTTMISANFLQPIAETQDAWQILQIVLPLIGWSQDETEKLLFGKSLCTLVIPDKSFVSVAEARPWCEAYVGYLDSESTNHLQQQLFETKKKYFDIVQNPHEILQKEFVEQQKRSIQWLSRRLVDSYVYMENVLNLAKEKNKSLAMAIA